MLYNYQFERTLTDSKRCNLFSVELYLASEVKKTVENAASTLKSKGTLDFLMFICTCIGKKSNIDKTYSADIQVHLQVKYCRFILGKNTCQNHLVQTNIWVLFLYSQLQSMAYSFNQLAVIRDSVFVHPPLIYWSLINFCWALILVDFIFWAETPNPMPTEERNITKFVLFEFVNMYPQTWIQRDSQAYDLPNIQCLHYFNIIYVSYEKMNFSKTMVFKSRYMYM